RAIGRDASSDEAVAVGSNGFGIRIATIREETGRNRGRSDFSDWTRHRTQRPGPAENPPCRIDRLRSFYATMNPETLRNVRATLQSSSEMATERVYRPVRDGHFVILARPVDRSRGRQAKIPQSLSICSDRTGNL